MGGMNTRYRNIRPKSEWLADLLARQRELIVEYWIEGIRAQDISSYRMISDDRLRTELLPTVDSMIYAFRTGDVEGPRKHSYKVIRSRVAQGFRLPELQISLHGLELAVIRIVQQSNVGPARIVEALQFACDMYYQVAMIIAAAYEDLREEQQKRFSQSQELGITLSRTLDLETVLQTAVRGVSEAAHNESVAILLEKARGDGEEVRASHGMDSEITKVLPVILKSIDCHKDKNIGHLARESASIVPDVRTCKAVHRWMARLQAHNHLSIICIPLIAKQKIIGCLALLRSKTGEVPDEEMDFYVSMAVHIANAIQNAQLYEEAKGKRELGVLLEASQVLASSLDKADILRKIAQIAIDSTNADMALVYSPAEQPGQSTHFEMHAVGKRARELLRLTSNVITLEDVERRYAASRKLLAAGKPIIMDDYSKMPEKVDHLVGLIKSGMIVPMRSKGKLVGAFGLYSLEIGKFTDNDLSIAMGLGDISAVAIENATLYEYERNIAETLQRSFLPAVLPEIMGYELSALYRAAIAEAQIGGDFYDVFSAGENRIGVVIADVSGKGLNAAAQTAMGKYMIRAFASEDPTPNSVLFRFNNAFCNYGPQGPFLTAFYCVLDTEENTILYADAGHNPPLYYSAATGKVSEVADGGICLGIECGISYENKFVRMQNGDVIFLYTDGATDVKRGAERLEIEGLTEMFISNAHLPAAEIIDRVFTDICKYSGNHLVDDIAMIAIRKVPGLVK